MDIGKHPLLKQCYELCLAIERCGASPELTDAVTKASALMNDIEKMTDAVEYAKKFLSIHHWNDNAPGRGCWDLDAAKKAYEALTHNEKVSRT